MYSDMIDDYGEGEINTTHTHVRQQSFITHIKTSRIRN